MKGVALGVGAAAAFTLATSSTTHSGNGVDYDSIRGEIADVLDNDAHDDGSLGPVFVRLAWHASGTYCKVTNTGGSYGATMRFSPEAFHGANAGLSIARNQLERIKRAHPEISYGDLWTLAAVVAIEEMGGPVVPWRSGRKDATAKVRPEATPGDRLPDAAQGAGHVRDVFYRMGFNDREIVALVGAHCLGRCHTDRSGYSGPWTRAPTAFTNMYFTELVNNTWTKKQWDGPMQYEDPTGELMMLPADMALLTDPKFSVIVKEYAADEEVFFQDFAQAFGKLLELGCPNLGDSSSDSTLMYAGAASAIIGAVLGYRIMSSGRAASNTVASS